MKIYTALHLMGRNTQSIHVLDLKDTKIMCKSPGLKTSQCKVPLGDCCFELTYKLNLNVV